MLFRLVNEDVRKNCIQYINTLYLNQYEVNIDELRRTNPQNRYYWMCVGIIAKEIGYDKNELHESFKRQFIGTDQGRDYFGNFYIRPKSSARLKKKEFIEYMNKVQAFASHENIILPQPDFFGLDVS